MTKENFITKWAFKYNVNYTTNPYFIYDLEAVIANEIEKAKEAQPKPEYICYKCENKTNNKFAICDKCNIGWNEPEQETLEPALNPIEQAYELGEKIRHKRWIKGEWLKKHTQTSSIDSYGRIDDLFTTRLIETPSDWELYTEPTEQVDEQFVKCICTNSLQVEKCIRNCGHGEEPEQETVEPAKQPTEQPAKPFDKDRFEAMFRAVVASGRTESYEQDFLATNICLEKLDAYYASKEGGNEK